MSGKKGQDETGTTTFSAHRPSQIRRTLYPTDSEKSSSSFSPLNGLL
jgi:hypothetical protein